MPTFSSPVPSSTVSICQFAKPHANPHFSSIDTNCLNPLSSTEVSMLVISPVPEYPVQLSLIEAVCPNQILSSPIISQRLMSNVSSKKSSIARATVLPVASLSMKLLDNATALVVPDGSSGCSTTIPTLPLLAPNTTALSLNQLSSSLREKASVLVKECVAIPMILRLICAVPSPSIMTVYPPPA